MPAMPTPPTTPTEAAPPGPDPHHRPDHGWGPQAGRTSAARTALFHAHPDTTFAIITEPDLSGTDVTAITWTDGPTIATVRTLLTGPLHLAPPHGDQLDARRAHSAALTAAAYLRAAAAGDTSWLTEPTPGALPGEADGQYRWAPELADDLDEADISYPLAQAARLAVMLTAPTPAQKLTPPDLWAVPTSLTLALFIAHHGDVLDAVLHDTH